MNVNSEITLLRRINEELLEENAYLRGKVDFYEKHPWVITGLKGETIIANLVSGCKTAYTCSHDIETASSHIRIEVKLANLNIANKGRETKRWTWIRPLGRTGNKKYERLLLLGESDIRFKQYYKDNNSPFVIFDVPFTEIPPLVSKAENVGQIILTTNPSKVKSLRGKLLYEKYQITRKELEERYKEIIESTA